MTEINPHITGRLRVNYASKTHMAVLTLHVLQSSDQVTVSKVESIDHRTGVF